MRITGITILFGILLILVALTQGCNAPDKALSMEVPTPKTVLVGKNAAVQVVFRNLPDEGCTIDNTWFDFGVQGEPMEAAVELPPSPGASGDRIRLQLEWKSSNVGILGGQMEPPFVSSPDGIELRPGARDVSLEFYFETLLAGTTELSLTLKRTNGSVVNQRVYVTVVATQPLEFPTLSLMTGNGCHTWRSIISTGFRGFLLRHPLKWVVSA